MTRNPFLGVLHYLLSPHARKPSSSTSDLEFLRRFRDIAAQHCSDSEFTTEVAAASVAMSRMHLNRKLRALTGKSTHKFIREVRLEAARAMILKQLPIGYVAKSVGFRSSSQFAKVFRERFGSSPSTFCALKQVARDPPGGGPPRTDHHSRPKR